MYKTKCKECGHTHCIVGYLGPNWVEYIFKCDQCGTEVSISRLTDGDEEIKDFEKKLKSIKSIDDFLKL